MRPRYRIVAATVAIAAVAAVAVVVAGSGGSPPTIGTHTQQALRRLAQKTGYTEYLDGRPYDIEAIRTTYRHAQPVMGGSSNPSPPATESVYLLAMRGQFNGLTDFVSRSKAIRVGAHERLPKVLEIMVAAKSLQTLESGTAATYPSISNPVSIG
jgi:hypothetical protein